MKVKVVYRNYRSLHDLYASFRIEPPQGVTYSIPQPKRYLRYLLPLHRRLGNLALVRFATSEVQRLFFQADTDDCDLYHFVQMISDSVPQIPYVVDFEHVSALVGFSKITPLITRQIERFLDDPGCCRVIPLTFAARKSLMHLLGDDYERIADKVDVVYPALPNYYALLKDEIDYSYVNPDPGKVKLLFVGSGVYRKGLPELLQAFHKLEGKYGGLELYVISDAPRELTRKYASDKIKYFLPRFSHQEIVGQFYLPADVFILPTHSDSFGMASLYALSCGTPVITTKQFANPEIVEPGRNGVFVHSQRLYLEQVPLPDRESKDEFYGRGAEQALIDSLVEKIEQLYLDRDVLARMSQQAVKDFEPGGKFSVDVRNRKLGEIYRSCLC
jgi:glycosyltransferase involved in cell wall biosynthesis